MLGLAILAVGAANQCGVVDNLHASLIHTTGLIDGYVHGFRVRFHGNNNASKMRELDEFSQKT